MTRRRLLAIAGILAAVLLTATRGVTAVMPVTLPLVGDQADAALLELRLAELAPAPGLSEALVDGSGQRIYLHADVVVSTVDVIGARVADAGSGRYSVSTEFSAAASARLTTATQAHLGRPVAILLDGRVLAAPVIRSPIGRSAVLTGDFTRERAEAIAAGLTAGRTVAAAATPAATSALSAVQQNAAVDAVSADDPSVVLPEATSKTMPVYPLAAQDARIQGIVELSAVVMPDGTVQDITVTESLDTEHGLDQSAMEALSLWRFKPGTKDGVIVPVRMTFVMRFTLS
jgi:TonB family protein